MQSLLKQSQEFKNLGGIRTDDLFLSFKIKDVKKADTKSHYDKLN